MQDKSTQQLHTGFLIFLNMLLINWLSQKQPTIELSDFGAEFVAMKVGMDVLWGIWYKLRMMDVPIAGRTTMETKSLLSITPNDQNQHWKRRTCPSATTLSAGLLQWVRYWRPMCGPRTISLTSWRRWPTDKSGATWWVPYYLTFMTAIPIRKADAQKALLNDCWMSKLVPSKSNLLLRSSNLRELRKLGWVETRRFPPYPTLLGREGAFFPEQKEASWKEWLSCNCQNGACPWHIELYQKIACMWGNRTNRTTETTTNWPQQVD